MPPSKMSASQEDYLETIYHLVSENQVARARDIARHLDVRSSSVTGALRTLGELKLINYAPYEVVTLTSKGEEAARQLVRKHEALRVFMTRVLGVDEPLADETACRMEHVVPREVLRRMAQFGEFLDQEPDMAEVWLDGFRDFCQVNDKIKQSEQPRQGDRMS